MKLILDINDSVVTLWCAQHGYPDPAQPNETEDSFLTRMAYGWIIDNTRGILGAKAREDAKVSVDQAESAALAAFDATVTLPPPVPVEKK